MSNLIINSAWNVRGLTPAEKCVLIRLADRADKDGTCFPGHESIAADCCLAVRSVRAIIPKLEAKGHIKVIRQTQRANFGQSVYIYKVHPSTPEPNASVTPEANASDSGIKVSPRRNGEASTAALAAKNIYRTLSESPINPQRGTGTHPHLHDNGGGKENAAQGIIKPLTGAETVVRHDELKRVEKAIEMLRSSYAGHQDWSEPDRKEYKALKARKAELLVILGMKV